MNENCPYCNKTFKKAGIHHHIQRIHEGKKVNYNPHGNKHSDETKKLLSDKIKKLHDEGKLPKNHTDEAKNKISEKARQSKHRRLIRSVRDYTKKDGTIIKMDSSWEEILAKRLDELNIEWIRPEPLLWFDKENKQHNYFPDFYLPFYDLYLDPKNEYAYNVQKEKIEYLLSNYDNLMIIKNINEIRNFDPRSLDKKIES